MSAWEKDQLSWEVVNAWKYGEDYDFDYDVRVKFQPYGETTSMIGSTFYPSGKPFSLWLNYLVKGSQIFCFSIKSGKLDEGFQWHDVFNLDCLDIETEIVYEKLPPPWWSISDRARLYGEHFFTKASSERQFKQPAFVVRFPQSNKFYDWQEASEFLSHLKMRIRGDL